MLALEWRLTLLALVVLPLFVIPARRVGRRLQDISREQMQHNAAMNTQMTERFNVAGRDARQAVRRPRPRGRAVRAPRRAASATPASGRRCTGGCSSSPSGSSAAVGAAAIYGVGGHLVVSRRASRPARWSPWPPWSTRVYAPLTGLTNARVDLMTSIVSFERVFEVLDAPEPIPSARARSTSSRPAGRVTFDDVHFRYPPAAETAIPSLEQPPPSADPDRDVLDGVEPRRSARRDASPSSARRAPASRRSRR